MADPTEPSSLPCSADALRAQPTAPSAELARVLALASSRFWPRIASGCGGCWIWTGALVNGYGSIFVFGRQVGVHRFAYELMREPIPHGLALDHLCRVRACVNPWHTEVVTNVENTMRGESPPAKNARKDACPKGHPLEKFTGQRRCRECHNEKNRARNKILKPWLSRSPERRERDRVRHLKYWHAVGKHKKAQKGASSG